MSREEGEEGRRQVEEEWKRVKKKREREKK